MSWPSIRLPIPSWNFPRGNVSFAGLVQKPQEREPFGTEEERKEGREKEREKEKQRWSASDTAWLSIGGVGTVEGGETYWSVASCTSSDEGVSRTDDGGEEVVRKGDCNPV